MIIAYPSGSGGKSNLVCVQTSSGEVCYTVTPDNTAHRAAFVRPDTRHLFNFNASPSSGDAYSDRRQTLNFELGVEFFVSRHVSL